MPSTYSVYAKFPDKAKPQDMIQRFAKMLMESTACWVISR